MSGRVAGKTAVVVGGASGSGLATARLLAAEGATVVIADIDAVAAAEAAATICADGWIATSLTVDISDEPSVERFAQALRASSPIDVLYNSAAITDPAHQQADRAPAEIDLAIWNCTLAVDLTGVMLTCRALLPLMRTPGGSIVNVTSNAGLAGNDTLAAYGAAKAALHQLTRAIATSYGHLGIRCNALSPAFIASASFHANVTPETAATMASSCLLGRFGTVDDVARAALFLCSDASSYVSGEVLRVDGGALGHLPGSLSGAAA